MEGVGCHNFVTLTGHNAMASATVSLVAPNTTDPSTASSQQCLLSRVPETAQRVSVEHFRLQWCALIRVNPFSYVSIGLFLHFKNYQP
jgi:hypothetical protein